MEPKVSLVDVVAVGGVLVVAGGGEADDADSDDAGAGAASDAAVKVAAPSMASCGFQ